MLFKYCCILAIAIPQCDSQTNAVGNLNQGELVNSEVKNVRAEISDSNDEVEQLTSNNGLDVLKLKASAEHAGAGGSCVDSLENNCEREVMAKLFESYSKVPRPVLNDSEVTVVEFNPGFYSLLDIDEVSQVMALYVWMRIYWYDRYLTWNPNDFGGKKNIKVASNMVWLPDYVIYQELGSTEPLKAEMKRIMISSDGMVSYLYPVVLRLFCQLKINRFPFDLQKCEMRFGTWFHKNHEVLLAAQNPEPDTRIFKSSSEWTLQKIVTVQENVTYLQYPISEVAYILYLKREPMFYLCTIIIPTVMIVVVSIVGLFAPNKNHEEREEKLSLGIASLLALAVVLMMVSDQMPKSATDIPIIAIFIITELLLCVLSTLLTVVIMRLQRKAIWGIPPPKSLQKFCRLFGPLDGEVRRKRKVSSKKKRDNAQKQKSDIIIIRDLKEKVEKNGSILNNNNNNNNYNNNNLQAHGNTEYLEDADTAGHSQWQYESNGHNNDKDPILLQWVAVCDRLDCIFRIVFLCISLMTFAWILLVGYFGNEETP